MSKKNRVTRPVTCASLIGVCFTLLFANIANAQQWQQYEDVQKAGWSVANLEKARQFAASSNSAAVMIVDDGNVVAAWGHVNHPYKSASIRKSLYDATMGAQHMQDAIDVDQTLSQLEIDDIEPLTDTEKKATLEQLMCARSGVYHPAAYEAQSNANRRPKRGSAEPGDQWYYNNWDFNLVCAAFIQLTDQSMKEAFTDRLVRPLGMEDFEPEHVFECLEPRLSNHPAVTMRTSARDLARVGKLYLQNGIWEGNSIVPKEWIARSTQPHTTFEKGHYRGEGRAYGRLWWIYPARNQPSSSYEQYQRILALGAGGQTMVMIPELNILMVHLADTDNGRGVSERSVEKLMALIIDARIGEPDSESKLKPVKVEKLKVKTPVPLPKYNAVPEKDRSHLEGTFMAEQLGVKLYQHDNRLFAQPIGQPLNDIEVFVMSDGSLRSPIVDLKMEPVANEDESIDALRLTFRGQTVVLKRSATNP